MTCEVVSISGIEFHKMALTDPFGNLLLDDDIESSEEEEELQVNEDPILHSPTAPVPSQTRHRHRSKAGWVGYVVKQLSSWLTVYQQQPTNLPLLPDLEDEDNVEDRPQKP
eukprot:TRINITY_DN4914_c0_g1_i1.p1 TRINITY_DN4914_c0_g1~~TRINITY_DN4914_c0_g1_i1.p1  ORF type:complete len:111 (-),score=15.94 TRINITY_DN4914_c0_g1_i1:84-416(-)